MRKNKTWEITLTNNSRFVANEPIDNAVVYTTDTEAYLNFRVTDSGFEFDSATIAMLNKDDGSIVERPMTKEDDTAVYEIESDIIPHFGLWQAQTLFKQGEEVFTSTPVTFVIERYMAAEQPPRLEDVANWKRLYDNATETIQELTRINDELNTTNQSVQQAEAQRASAESSRVSAEEQRKTEHANRGAEFDGKADKIVINNLIPNGNFSQGLTGFIPISTSRDKLKKTENGLKVTSLIDANDLGFYAPKLNLIQGNSYYICVAHDTDSSKIRTSDNFRFQSLSNPIQSAKLTYGENLSSAKFNATSSYNIAYFSAGTTTSNPDQIKTGDSYTINHISLIDLTTTFGAGNEPSKEEMDELIKITGYIDGEYALNNKEMLKWTLALIRRNKNAIITLGGA